MIRNRNKPAAASLTVCRLTHFKQDGGRKYGFLILARPTPQRFDKVQDLAGSVFIRMIPDNMPLPLGCDLGGFIRMV